MPSASSTSTQIRIEWKAQLANVMDNPSPAFR
jgi:hypothetical protein